MKLEEDDKQLSTLERFAALSRVGTALMSELDETRLLHLIAETACDLTGAEFAAFSLRPTDEAGQPLVPSEGNLFHLAAVVGVTEEQEALFRRMPLGGEGLLAPIFHHGVSVLVPDALVDIAHSTDAPAVERRDAAREAAFAYAHGQLPSEELRSMGIPRGHPVVRSFLGAPLLDRDKQVRGGLLLGHTDPHRFTSEDEVLLVSLAAQAAVALENARLYRTVQMRAQELNALFESIADGVTLVDRHEQIRRENGTARQLREHLQVHPEGERILTALLHAPARSALADKTVQDITVTIRERHGETKEYLVTASPLRRPTLSSGPLPMSGEVENTGDSPISGAVVVWHDVTERRIREAERVAREHASQLEAIFEAIPDGVFVYDREGRTIQTNSVARELLSRIFSSDLVRSSPQERFTQMLTTDDRGHPFEQSPLSRLLAGEVLMPDQAVDISLRTIDGQTLHTRLTGGPFHDGQRNLLGAVLICRDVTERYRLEEIERQAHAEAENHVALLQLILDELPSSAYLVRGKDARLVLANRAATEVWGAQWPQGQPFAMFLEENGIHIFGVDGRPLELSQLATVRALHHAESVYQSQESIRHSDGTTLPVLVSAVALNVHEFYFPPSETKNLGAERSEPAAIVVHQNVTALKEAERLKDEFIALAAHELRTPLAILKGFAQTLILQTARGKGPELAEWQLEALQEIDQSTARMVELTEDLLDVTRLQAGRLELYLEPKDLVSLLQRLMTRIQMTTEHHQLSLHTALPHLVVLVDLRRAEQVITNLLNNAIKYSPGGGSIEMGIQHDEKTRMALVCISDHGIGIPAHQQAHIFGRFARAENAQTYGIGGTGLGLYLCRELVERHGGRIWFESIEGQGSTFFVALPLLSETPISSQES
jgi:signal transduction histidine kinase/GAF domain-containing protein